jgi:hypothetical protein
MEETSKVLEKMAAGMCQKKDYFPEIFTVIVIIIIPSN